MPLHRFAIVAPVMLVFAFASNFIYALAECKLLRDYVDWPGPLLWFNRVMAAVLVLTAWVDDPRVERRSLHPAPSAEHQGRNAGHVARRDGCGASSRSPCP